MEWQNLQQWLDTLDGDEVCISWLLSNFPDFPRYRLGGYVRPSSEPTVTVSHLRAVADRYGDDTAGGTAKVKIPNNTASTDDGDSTSRTEEDEYQFLKETIEKVSAIHGSDTTE